MKIAHLINPYKCPKENKSYLYYAQPITFQSMRSAQLEAKDKNIEVELCSAFFKEDEEIVPDYFVKLPYLVNSTMNFFPRISGNKKLPIIQEMFNKVLNKTNADYIIFTNTDIGIQKNFYVIVRDIIEKTKSNSFIINRRNNIPKFKNGKRLGPDDLDIIYKEKGRKHPGFDCFVINRNLLKKINLNKMFTAYPPWGNTLNIKLKRLNPKHVVYKNLFLTFHIGSDSPWVRENKNRMTLRKKNIEIARKILLNRPSHNISFNLKNKLNNRVNTRINTRINNRKKKLNNNRTGIIRV